MNRPARIGLAIAALAVAASVLFVAFITQTDRGHEMVRRQVVAILNDNSHGIIRIQGVGGNLLGRIRLNGISVTDSAGRPLLLADTIETDYGFRAVLGRRVELSGLRLVRPRIMIEKLPGGRWNYDRIFPRDTVTRVGVRPTGWGTWIRFTDITMLDGRLITRIPWEPSALLSPAERESAITVALGIDNRMYVERVPGGFQRVSDFRHIDAHIPLARLVDPNQEFSVVDVEVLRTEAYPYRPPGLTISALTGEIRFTGDSIWWSGARAQLAGSRVALDGRYTIESGDVTLRLVGNPINPGDIRWLFPEYPRNGQGRLEFALDWIGDSSRYVIRNLDMRTEGAHIRGHFGMTDADTTAFHSGSNLRFTGLSTGLVTRILDLEFPRSGTLTGFAHFSGGFNALRLNGDLALANRAGTSHVLADGTIGFPELGYTFRDFRMQMDPVTADLARVVIPNIPFDGLFTGLATVNGTTTGLVTATGDVTHVEAGRRSRVVGEIAVRPSDPVLSFDANARFAPLSLATVGQFTPELGLRGFVSGPFRATGTTDDFTLNTTLNASGGGDIQLRGRLAMGGRRPGYDLALDAVLFNANAISTHAPQTSLTAIARAEGVGVDLATMRGSVVADIRTSSYDTVAVDSAKIRVTIADGLAHFDTLAVNVPTGFAHASGSIGLVDGREGELAYEIEIDSLSAFAGIIGGEPGETEPRPGILAERLERARADSALLAERTEVERAATGAAPPRLQVDTPTAVPRDVVTGSLRAEGTARGNIRRLSLTGTASGQDITARGHFAEHFATEYRLDHLGTRNARINATASLITAHLGGFELDTVHAQVNHTSGRGQAEVTVRQDDLRLYAANADYVLHADHNEVHLNDLRLRFDTTVWQSLRPSAIEWGGRGIVVEDLELTAGEGRRLYVNGLVPSEGVADLRVVAERFELGDIAGVLQSDIDARGLISFDVQARGRAADPTISGTIAAEDFTYQGGSLPRVTGTFNYAGETVTGRFEATRRDDPRTLVLAEGTIPINLALTGVTASRIPRDRQIDLLVHADSFPIGIIPGASDYATDITGRTTGSVRLGGTLRRLEVAGDVTVAGAAMKVVPLGIRVVNVFGHIRLTGDTVIIDSLAGRSAGGLVRLSGGVGLRTITEPAFDLSLVADNARIIDNHHGRMKVDAQLALYGPFRNAFLSGGVRFREGVFNIPEPDDKHVIGTGDPALFNVLDTAVVTERELFPGQSPLLANLEVDVRLRVDRDVFVRSRDANIEVYTESDLIVLADRSREVLKLDGILLSDRGDYLFMQKRFRIRRGSATFVGLSDINPTLQVTGEYEVRLPAREAIMIQIAIGGTLRQPKIELHSTAQPPLSQTDLLSYLAFGRSSSSLTQLEGASLTSGSASGSLIGQGAALAVRQLATVAVGTLTEEFAGEVAHSLGADVFIITPADVQTDVGNFLRSTELEFGKYVRPATFMALQARPDPQSLRRPGFQIEHRFQRLQGYQFRLFLGPRYMLREPTLAEREPQTRSVFGAFIIREWRY